MGHRPPPSPARLRRLAEELEESGLDLDGDEWRGLLLPEIDLALRPPVFERRVPSHGVILEPTTDPEGWDAATQLDIVLVPIGDHPLEQARRFADGIASWVVRRL